MTKEFWTKVGQILLALLKHIGTLGLAALVKWIKGLKDDSGVKKAAQEAKDLVAKEADELKKKINDKLGK